MLCYNDNYERKRIKIFLFEIGSLAKQLIAKPYKKLKINKNVFFLSNNKN